MKDLYIRSYNKLMTHISNRVETSEMNSIELAIDMKRKIRIIFTSKNCSKKGKISSKVLITKE